MKKTVSVIIPTYNRENTIKESLNSVFHQTYPHWECIIIDDGSTDKSEEVIKAFVSKDRRFKLLKRSSERKKGAATCRNIGLENAIGDFIQFLDSDDILAHNKFEFQLQCLQKEVENTVATCKYGIARPIWDKPRIINGLASYKNYDNPIDLFRTFTRNFGYFPLHVYLVPATVIGLAGNWNEKLTVNDDGEYFSRVLLNCESVKFCNDTYVLYRTGAGNRLSKRIMDEHGVKSYVDSWTLIEENICNKTGKKNHLYVQGAKRNLYQRLLRENQNLISRNRNFLKNRWSKILYLFNKGLNKIRNKILVSYIEV